MGSGDEMAVEPAKTLTAPLKVNVSVQLAYPGQKLATLFPRKMRQRMGTKSARVRIFQEMTSLLWSQATPYDLRKTCHMEDDATLCG
jgi:hypothetical protein